MATDRAFAAAGLTRTITHEVNDIPSIIEVIRYGLAVGLLPASTAAGVDGITVVPIRHYTPRFQTAIAVSSNRRLSAATQALLDTIKRHAGI